MYFGRQGLNAPCLAFYGVFKKTDKDFGIEYFVMDPGYSSDEYIQGGLFCVQNEAAFNSATFLQHFGVYNAVKALKVYCILEM